MMVITVSYDVQVGAHADRTVTVTDGVLNGGDTALTASPRPMIREHVWSAADADRCR
jgi:methyl coenzyme M reductase subunit D